MKENKRVEIVIGKTRYGYCVLELPYTKDLEEIFEIAHKERKNLSDEMLSDLFIIIVLLPILLPILVIIRLLKGGDALEEEEKD